jgi:AcrR family transcriptional regulator
MDGVMDKDLAELSQLGRRERGKLDKRRRIREATRDVFRRKGYDAATTREIAELADVAIGTLFAYAADKRELLMMVINDDREALPEVDRRRYRGSGDDVLSILMSFFEPRYEYWAQQPELSRLAVQHTIDYDLARHPGPELARFEAGRQILLKQLAELFEEEQHRGRIVTAQPAATIARLFMEIYQAEVRQWLRAERPNVAEGLSRLSELFELALSGVAKTKRRALAGRGRRAAGVRRVRVRKARLRKSV